MTRKPSIMPVMRTALLETIVTNEKDAMDIRHYVTVASTRIVRMSSGDLAVLLSTPLCPSGETPIVHVQAALVNGTEHLFL